MTTTEQTYSQYGEDIVIAQHVPEHSRLLDLGAWNAKDKSNSRLLIERGWDALLVEPSPEPFLGLLKEYANHSRVQLINAAIGFERCMVKMHATADAVSTTDEGVYQKWRTAGGFYGWFWTPVFTLSDLFNQFGGDFAFVNIDTEGTSVDVFKALLDTGNRPKCICVEHDDRIVEVTQHAQAAGYKQVTLNGTNAVYAL